MTRFDWQKTPYGDFRAEMPGNVTLVVAPRRTTGFANKPARGTAWFAQASHWDETTRTMSRYGRDEYMVDRKTSKDAMRAAELIYTAATA